MRSSLEPNTVNMLACLRSWLSDDITSELLLFTVYNRILGKISYFDQYMKE